MRSPMTMLPITNSTMKQQSKHPLGTGWGRKDKTAHTELEN